MQLLVRVVDKISADKGKNIQLTKRGDVIAVKQDGESWGSRELDNPDWRIFQIPLTDLEAQNLLQPEIPKQASPDQPMMKRLFKLDIDAMQAKGYQIDVSRRGTIAIVKADVVQIQKPDSKDPNIIGPEPKEIGI